MTKIISATVGGLRGPGVTAADRQELATAVAAGQLAKTGAETALAAARLIVPDLQFYATGNLLPNALHDYRVFDGAHPVVTPSGIDEITIDANRAGKDSFIQLTDPIDGAALAGATLRVFMAAEVTAPFTRVLVPRLSFVKANGSVPGRNPIAQSSTVLGNIRTWTLDVLAEADDVGVRPFVQNDSAVPTAVAEGFRMVDLRHGVVSGADRSAADLNAGERIDRAISDAAVSGDSELLQTMAVQPQNGASKIFGPNGEQIGLSVAPRDAPPGQNSAYNSLLQLHFPLDPSMAGSIEEFRIEVDLSAVYTRGQIRGVFLVDTVNGASFPTPIYDELFQVDGKVYWDIAYRLRTGDLELGPYFLMDATTDNVAGPNPETFTVTKTKRSYLTSSNPALKVAEANRARFRARLLGEAVSTAVLGPRQTVLRVEPNGGGDFVSVAAALASITDNSPSKPYLILLGIGVDTLTSNVVAKNFVTIRGVNKHLSIMRFEQPDNTPVGQIGQSQVMYTTARLRLENLTAEVRNVRYVFHTDSNNLYNLNSVIEMVSIIVRHLGNDGAMDYQASLVDQNDPAAIAAARAVVAGSVPLGTGLGSGDYLLLDDVDAEGPWGAGFGAHNNAGSTEPATYVIRNCRSSARETAKYATFTCLGSLQADKVIIEGSDVGEGINYTCPNWPTILASQQPAFRCEWGISGYGNQPAAFRVTLNDALALRITSADETAATKVEVDNTSSAAPVLFKTVITMPGGVGLAASVRSWFDVSGKTAGTSLGQRLGDCRAVNKILRVRFQGGAWKVVTFNTDLTNASNDDVLVIIRAAVGQAGLVDLWDVARETFRPRFRNEEKSLRNTTGTAIRRRMALAYNGARDAVRPMRSTDPADLFAGIAWENILPGKTGRVKTAGYLPFEDVTCTGLDGFGNGLQFNQTLSIDADEAGKLYPAPNGIMRVVRAAADGLSAVVAVRAA